VDGKLVSEDVTEQTTKAFANISAILETAESALDRVLKVNIYMVDKTDYAGMNEVYAKICVVILLFVIRSKKLLFLNSNSSFS
jgi:enamine deaminase RidA (YjgF/YER057c/UK114 family)